LLKAFANGRFVLSRLRLLTAESPQSGSEDRARGHSGSAEGKDSAYHGQEHDNDENQGP
jgi:hypothetical protein